MSTPEETLCFTCSQPLGDPPRLNHLPSGQVCPCCAERLLETLPALLPSKGGPRVPVSEPETGPAAEPAPVRIPRRLPPEQPDFPTGA